MQQQYILRRQQAAESFGLFFTYSTFGLLFTYSTFAHASGWTIVLRNGGGADDLARDFGSCLNSKPIWHVTLGSACVTRTGNFLSGQHDERQARNSAARS
jgi:hypothetical protein